MPEVHHGGINAGDNVSIGGDVEMNIDTEVVTTTTNAPPADERPVTDDLRQRVTELVAAIDGAGLSRRPPVATAAIELQSEVDGPTTRPARVEHLLAAIESHAVQIAAIAAAITATRLALSR